MQKILCTTDETEVSRKAEAFAAQLAKGAAAELHYVYVSLVTPEDLKSPGHFDVVIPEEVEALSHKALQNAAASAKANGLTDANFLTLYGHDVAKAVVEYAESNGCDHIVTGSNGRVGIPRLVLGSVSEGIIRKAHCPVTVIR